MLGFVYFRHLGVCHFVGGYFSGGVRSSEKNMPVAHSLVYIYI